MTHNEKVQALRALLEKSVHDRLSGGPVALQLSGGLDSAVIQAIAGLDRLYCCTWLEFDNLEAASLAACGHHVKPVTFSREEMIEVALPEVAKLTRGRGTWSQCCQWFMARAMSADGVKVELNGEGSDELFSGYARYRILYWLERMLSDPHLQEYRGWSDWVLGTSTTCGLKFTPTMEMVLVYRYMQRTVPAGCGYLVESVATRMADGWSMTDAIGFADEHGGLAELVGFEKAVAESHGLEHRWPFMDAAVVEFAHTLTEADKITELESKHILRDVARSLGVHTAIVNEVTKRGLVVPPSWAPEGAAKWSRGWFEKLMAAEWQRQQERAA